MRDPATDLLGPLLGLAGVAEAVAEAQAAVIQLRGNQNKARAAVGDHGADTFGQERRLRAAHASAMLAGAKCDVDELRSGATVDPIARGVVRSYAELDRLLPVWRQAPLQALARLHLLAGVDLVDTAELGRPRELDSAAAARLDACVQLITSASTDYAVVLASIVHGELLALDLFGQITGVVARGASWLTLAAFDVDPRFIVAPDIGHMARQPEYVGASRTYLTGTADGVRAWLKHCALAVTSGAQSAPIVD